MRPRNGPVVSVPNGRQQRVVGVIPRSRPITGAGATVRAPAPVRKPVGAKPLADLGFAVDTDGVDGRAPLYSSRADSW